MVNVAHQKVAMVVEIRAQKYTKSHIDAAMAAGLRTIGALNKFRWSLMNHYGEQRKSLPL